MDDKWHHDMWLAQKEQCQQNYTGMQASAIPDHEDYNERMAERRNPQPKMSQQEVKHQEPTNRRRGVMEAATVGVNHRWFGVINGPKRNL